MTALPAASQRTLSVPFRAAIGLASAMLLLLVALAAPVVASADEGFEGHVGPSGAPTGSKPESKIWFNDGQWWATMYNTADGGGVNIWRLNRATQTWVQTAAVVDTRQNVRTDALWDGTKLYVASYRFSENTVAQEADSDIRRYSYNTSTDTYTLDSGFPVTINVLRTETLVIAKDSTNQLWATWEAGGQIWVNRSTTSESEWGTAFVLPGSSDVSSDDIPTIIAFGGNKIGVLYSNQDDHADEFIVHNDADADATWQPLEAAYAGTDLADDHLNLKTDSAGRVYAAVKTSGSGSDPLIVVLVRSAGGSWTNHTVSPATTDHTRPIVIVDEVNNLLRVFYPSDTQGGTINQKTSPISSISFAAGEGEVVMEDTSADDLNNVTSTKQNVTSASGLIILAYNDTTTRYWHSDIVPGGGVGNTPPTANATSAQTPTSTAVAVPLSGSDVETCQLTFSIVTPPAHGGLGFITNNACSAGTPNTDTATITYTPTTGYTGPDSFTYKVNDGTTDSAPATASLNIGDPDLTAPVRGATAVNGASLTIGYDEPLDTASVPAPGAYAVTVAGSPRAVNTVGIAGSTVTLTLASPVGVGQAVTLGYTPGATPVQDLVGNDAAAFSGVAVTNNTTSTPTTLTFAPTDDAQVKSTSPTANYGNLTTMQLRQDPGTGVTYRDYVRFNVAGVTGSVSSVKLRLFVTTSSNNTASVLATASTWAESTITWNTAPALGPTVLGSSVPTPAGAYMEIELGAGAVSADGAHAFVLRSSGTSSALFSSSEGANTPQLLVTFSSGPPPDVTAPVRGATAVNGASLTIAYDEPLDTGSVPAPGDYAVTVAGSPRAVSTVGITGSTVTLTLASPVLHGEAVTLGYTPGAAPVQDLAGNDAAAFSGAVVTNDTPDTTGPVRGATAVNGTSLTIAYDEPLDAGSVPAPGDYAVTVAGSPRAVDTVGIAGSTVTLTLASPVISTDAVTLSYTPGAAPVQDVLGNDAASFSDATVTNDTPAPDLTPPVRGATAVNGASLTIVYDEPLDTGSVPAAAAFEVSVNGGARAVNTVGIAGSTVTLTLASPVVVGDTITLTYTAPVTNPVQDLSGNDAASYADAAVTNNTADVTAPVRGATAVNGTSLTIAYDEPLDTGSVPAPGAYAVTVAGSPRAVSTVAIAGSTVTLTLASPVINGQAVTLGYTPGAAPVQDLAGNDAAGFSGAVVTNDTPDTTGPVRGTTAVNGTSLTIAYDEPLDTGSVPAPGDYAVTVAGSPRAVDTVGIAGSTVTLTLASPVLHGEAVTLSYTPGAAPVQDVLGNDAASFSGVAVTNNTPDLAPPVRGTTAVNGASLTIAYDEPLDTGSVPTAGAYAVTVAGSPRAVNTVGIAGSTVTLTLASPVTSGQAVTLGYTPGGAPVQDLAGNDAASFSGATVTNNTSSAPTVLTFTPTDDAQVKSTSPTANYGALTTMQLRQDPGTGVTYRDYIRFNVAGVTGSVSSVKLRLFVNTASANTASVFAVANTWTESTINWNTAPALGPTALGGQPATPAGAYKEIELGASAVGGNGAVAYAVRSSGTSSAIFSSSEGANPPQLVVTFSSGAPSDTTAPVRGTTAVNGASLTIAYDEPLDTGSVPAAGAYAVTVAGSPRAVNTVGIAGSTVTLTLASPVTSGQAVTLGYTPGGAPVQDLAGNDAASFSGATVTNNTPPSDTTAPVRGTTAVNGASLTIAYDEPLDTGSVPAAGAYAVTVAGSPRAVNTVGIAGSTVTLTLASPVTSGQAVTLGYTPGGAPVQDLAGNDAASFSGATVTNNTPPSDTTAPVRGTTAVNGASLTIAYDEPLDTGSVPTAGAYAVTVAGSPRAVNTVGIAGSTVTLTLASPVTSGQAVTLGYTPGGAPVQDLAGNDAASFSGATVTNNTSSAPTVLTFTPTDDAHVKSTSPTANYGNLTTMQLRQDPGTGVTYRDYVRFNVAGVTGSVSSVKLRLFVTTSSNNTASVLATASTWAESTITWNTAPALGPTVLGSTVPTPAGTYVEIELGAGAVSADGAHAFVLRSSGTSSALFSSSEGANPPQLVVTFN